ncbi:hypothetical protein [Variovorax sp. 770b2]|uniref:hypothetical protein n=1 Tax=Variovorax sp. 770b2 TaxID=1566271 RepID=UPI0011608D1E|nr:hypothetical protein [Variovorax sp. 770b2]
MDLEEYFAEFKTAVNVGAGFGLTVHVAAEVAAGHSIGLTFAQMHAFLARRTQITSVAFALKGPFLSPEQIARIDLARAEGAVDPKDVILRAFTQEEVRSDLLTKIST